MTNAHNFLGTFTGGGHDKVRRKRCRLYQERMIARGFERVVHAGKDGPTVMGNAAGLAVHDAPGTDDSCAERLGDALMSQADAQDRNPTGQSADDVHTDARLHRPAGARTEDHVRRFPPFYLVHGNPIVSMDLEGNEIAAPILIPWAREISEIVELP